MLNIFRGPRPDITPAMVIAAIFAAAAPICLLIGVDLSSAQLDALEQLRLVAVALVGGDAAIRIGRNYADGKTQAAAHLAAAQAGPPALEDPGVVDVEADQVADDELPDDEAEFASPPPARP